MYTNDELKNLSDNEKKRKRNSLQMEIIMLESESKKFVAEKNSLDAELRKLRIEGERLRIAMDEKKKRFDWVSQEILGRETEIRNIRKKINLL